MNKLKNSLRKNASSYRHALSGIIKGFTTENNMRYHLVAAMFVMVINSVLSVTLTEWGITILAVGLVLMAELFNTAIEKLCDHLHPAHHPSIGTVKDLAAGAVLVVSIAALVVGLIIYLPHLTTSPFSVL